MWLTKRSNNRRAASAGPYERHTAAAQQEEFLRLPRAEFLLNQLQRDSDDLAKHIVNQLESLEQFSLKAGDDSMADAGIRSGDSIVLEHRESYHDGDLVAVALGKHILIRRYATSHGRVRLTSTAEPDRILIADPETPGFTIIGCVIQVIREIR